MALFQCVMGPSLQIGLALVTAALLILSSVVFFRPAQIAAIFAKVAFFNSEQFQLKEMTPLHFIGPDLNSSTSK